MNVQVRRLLVAAVLLAAVLAVTGAACGGGVARAGAPAAGGHRVQRPVALVYRGPAACDGCPEAAADMLARQPQHFVIRYIGPRQRLRFSARALRGVALFVLPGGGNDVDQAWRGLRDDPGFSPALVRDYVRAGGRYLGICMGGYLAGITAGNGGLRLLPGDSAEYVGSSGARVATTADTLVQVTWLGGHRPRPRTMYFQDGPYFQLSDPRTDPQARAAVVLARYRSVGEPVAIMIVPYGRGRVAVSGPHPEATPDWYTANGLTSFYAADIDIGNALIAALMAGP
jgi:glutamine amidotransferase-like uncharacterized protein